MPPGEDQGRVSAGGGGGGRPAGSRESSSRAGGGACPRRLLPPASAPALGSPVRVRASERFLLPPSSVRSSSLCWVRWRWSGSLASRSGRSSWETRRGGRAGWRRLWAPLTHLSQSAVGAGACVDLPAPRGRLSRRSHAQLLPGRLPVGSFRVVLMSGWWLPVGGRGWDWGAATR